MIRVLDILISAIGILIFALPIVVFCLISLIGGSPPIFKQTRLGQNKQTFSLLKLRTMRLGTDELPTHLIDSSQVTRVGNVLRSSKVDELPQLLNVFLGQMSLVGPRPCLLNQKELIDAREKLDVFAVRPGITGLAQISGVDMSSPVSLAKLDAKMISNLTLNNYFYLIFLTFMKILVRSNKVFPH